MAHDHAPANYGRAFAIGITLNVIYVAIEAGYGFYSDSLALISDAGHNLSDVLGLLLAWGAYALARVRPSQRRTYGLRSSTILAALFNALILLVAIGAIVWESVARFFEPVEPAAMTMIIVAAVGVVVNTATALMFMKGRHDDLNVRGAFLHMAADAGVSVGVVIAGIGIEWTGWTLIDPTTSLLIALLIFVSTWGLLRESVNLAIQAVPAGIDPQAVEQYLAGVSGITAVHDLHIWAMSTTETALTVHLVKPQLENEDSLLQQIQRELHDRFRIEHVTIQIERSDDPANCHQAHPEHV